MILENAKSSEKIVRMIETENIIMFETDKKVKKQEIADEVEKMFKVKVVAVSTHIRNNEKIAFIKLKKENPAIDVAAKLGLM